ncbi:hypothetical protein, partial [Apilactobacillus xinyiensis]|uniref:hypothetical protein n=1 Tax=Apilactobacillus xinyiensis TaxID=2841032 RepID=UPI00200FD78F
TDGNHGSTETDGNHGSTGTDGNHGSDQTSNTPLSKDAQNGFNDALNNKTNSDTNTNDDYSKAFNEGQQKKSIIDQAASDAYNSKANNASVYNDNDDKSYYNNAYNGVINAQSQYNNAVQDKGTSDQYDGYDTSKDTNAQTAQQNQQKYESDYLSKYNSNSNYSVRSGEVKIPTVDTIYNNGGDVNQANAYADLAYKYGIQYFLSHQGAADAESGKWNGIVQGQDLNGKTGNVYTPSADSSNPYDLAYRGVQDAINQQFDNNNNLKFNSNNYSQLTTSNADDFYKSGFNDVVNQIKQGSVFVSNASQYKNTFFGNNNALSTSTIANVKIVNDINFDKDDNYSAPQNSVTSKNNVSIDAQNHIVDFKSYNVNFTFSDANNGMLTVKNFRTYYSENYYGSITLTNANATFENINYVGPQMLNSSSSNAYMSGVVNSFNVTNVSNPFTMNNSSNNPITKNKIDHSYRVYNDSAQCNLEIKNLSLNPGAKFFGRSDEYIGGTVANVTGNLSLGKNSEMVLVPRGNGGEDNWNGQSVGINLSGSLNLNNNSKLDIISSTSSDSSRITNYNYSPSIYTSGSVNILGGSLRTFTNGSIYSSGSYSDTSIYSSGTINIKDSGSLFVYSDNLGNSSTKSNYGLIYNGANLNVSNKGNLYVSAGSNSTGAITLLGGNAINVNDPGETHVVFDLTGNNNPQSKLFYATNLTGYAVKVRNAKDGQFGGPYYKYTVNSDGSISSVGANLNQSSSKNGTIGNYLEFNGVPSVYYNSPLTISAKPDSNGNYQLNGSVKVYDHQSDLNIYIQVKSGNSTSYDSLNSDINNDKSNSDKNISDVTGYLYNTVISLPADYKDGDNVNFSIDVPKNKISQGTSLGTLIRYGVTGIDSTLGNISVDSSGNTNMNSSSYNVNSNNYDLDSNGKLTKKGSTVIVNNGSLSNIGTGVSDGIMDASNNNSNNKKAGQYPSNVDYTNAYDSALAGYNDYYSGNNNNSPANEYAYQQGRDAAQKDSVAFTNGANAYVTNQQKADNTNQTKKYQDNYSKGYDDAQAGYAAVTDATPNPSTDGQSSAYAIGVNVGKAAKAGIDDDIKGNGDNSANYTDRNQKLAYQNAQLAYQAGLAGKDAKDSNASKNDKAYQAGSAANNGIKDAQSKPEGKASDYG